MLKTEKEIIYEGWLTGFFAQSYKDVLKVLLICSHDDIRVDRVANRDNITVKEAKNWIKNREKENITKWQKLYGNNDFWDPKYFDLVIDTYKTGSMETLGKVLDKIGYDLNKITISGKICTGKTSLFKNLEKELNWPVFMTGKLFRDYVAKINLILNKSKNKMKD